MNSYGYIDTFCCHSPFYDVPILLDEQLHCNGTEDILADCLKDGWDSSIGIHDCSHAEDLYIYCIGEWNAEDKLILLERVTH